MSKKEILVTDCYVDCEGVWHYCENGDTWVTRPKELKKPEIDYDAWIFKKAGLTADEIRRIEEDFYVTRCDEDYKRKKEEEMRQYELLYSDSPINEHESETIIDNGYVR